MRFGASQPVPATPSNPEPPTGGEAPPGPPEAQDFSRTTPEDVQLVPCGPLGLERLGCTQAIGGLALGLIALFSSYYHISFAGRTLLLQQQWGIPFIAASVAIVFG